MLSTFYQIYDDKLLRVRVSEYEKDGVCEN